MNKDFYNILGVAEDAPADRIKKAYRSLAKKFHPDRNKGDKTSEEKFKEVQEAYSVLSDPKQREEYDLMRKYGPATGAAQAGFGADGMSGVDLSDLLRGGSGGRVFRFQTGGESGTADDIEDLLSSFLGGRKRGRRAQSFATGAREEEDVFTGNRTRRGADLAPQRPCMRTIRTRLYG
jgi:molecular chaperone DnaJ